MNIQKRRLMIDFAVDFPMGEVSNHVIAKWIKDDLVKHVGIVGAPTVWEKDRGMAIDTFNGEWRWL